MGNLRKVLLQSHFKPKLNQNITLNKEIIKKLSKLATFKPKLAKIITLNGKSKEIATSKPLKFKIIFKYF